MRGQEPDTHTCWVCKHAAFTKTGLSCSLPGRTVSDSMGEMTPCSLLLNPAQGIKVKRKLSVPGSPKLWIQRGHFCHSSLTNSESWAAEMPTVALTSAISSSIFGVYDQAPLYFCLCRISLSIKNKKVKIFFFMDYKTQFFSFWVKR